ncbi:MAG TPA: N-acetylglucosamine-6-phosphate deacetylase [Bryobacteraceae bacterium]|nr:N-acetylglucosamine-6-phosphate deacetylase [Bryobacteraceae bacterium]
MKCIGIDVASGATLGVDFDETIREVGAATSTTDLYLAPGWIDIQVNGYAGVDYNRPGTPHEEIARSVHVLYSTGVTRFYPTVITGAPEDMLGALRNLSRAKDELKEGAAMDGFHVEGPHISPEEGPRGAHPRRWVRPPDIDEFRRWQEAADGRIRIVTLAPEWPEAPRYIEAAAGAGVVVSIGHTNAEGHHIRDAVSAGATLSTHLGNGAHSLIRRHPNYILEQLAEDRLMADFIVDGIHLPACYVKVAVRAKGIERAVLVTDASSPAGCKPGRYFLGEQAVDLTADQRVVLAGQERLAGSALSMDRGVENLMKFAGITLAEAVRLATTNAARAGRVPGRSNGLAAGDRADFVRFHFDAASSSIRIAETWVSGERVYAA